MVVKKTKKRVFVWKPIIAVSGAVIAVFVVIFFVLYFANKPNYRDLEKEFERISANIPADWQLVSESSNKGTWGLFCLQVEGSECPHLIAEYRRDTLSVQQPNLIIDGLESILLSSGFALLGDSYQKCTTTDIENPDYTCSASGFINNVRANISLKSISSAGEIGNWSSLSLSSYEE